VAGAESVRCASRAGGVAVAALAVLTVTACGGSSSTPSASPTGSDTASTTTGTSPSPAGPSYAPASGKRVSLPQLTLRAPAAYDVDTSYPLIPGAYDPRTGSELTFADIHVFPGTSNGRFAHLVLKNADWHPRPRRMPDVTVDGRTFYHLAGPTHAGTYVDDYGRVEGPRSVELTFEVRRVSPAARRRLVGSVLASVHFR
jgi:hypothetical protein